MPGYHEVPDSSKTNLVLDASRQLTGGGGGLVIGENATEPDVNGETPNPNPWQAARQDAGQQQAGSGQQQRDDNRGEYLSSDMKFAILVAVLIVLVGCVATMVSRVNASIYIYDFISAESISGLLCN